MKIFPPHATLGILTTQTEGNPPFLNRGFYRRLCLAGEQAGIRVFVFSPLGIDWTTGSVTGFSCGAASDQWTRRRYALPHAVYDRCFCTDRRQHAEYRSAVQRLREMRSVLFLGYGLKGKLEVQQLLERDGRFARHLPATEAMRSVRSVVGWLRTRGLVLLKPQAGSQGRGVLLVRRGPDAAIPVREAAAPAAETADAPGTTANAKPAFTVIGRDGRNRRVERGFADGPALLRWLRGFTGRRSYLLQQYLPLQSRSGDAYDVRSLVQKDGAGRWRVTGMAVRLGQDGSLTSNLHGGGRVEPADTFLASQFGAARAQSLISELRGLSEQIPEALERYHGRLAELGIDFGIDTGGHIWILEANSKPGRSVFTYLHDDKARSDALINPIRYARYLLRTSAFPTKSF